MSFAGQGLIRWTEPDERLLGIEILALDEACRDWAFGLIATNAVELHSTSSVLGDSKI